ncbi:hypothetical protein [Nonomuraea typhae]|uniref:Uncharacterized protein n=1 Tax=Nonomuraea typhae TaxID=2603600 RepID=A0ABW7Z0R5_9ACTN
MELNPRGLPDLWRPPVVEYAEKLVPEACYLLAWGDDLDGERWGYLLRRPRHQDGQARWVRWEAIRPVAGEDYDGVPLCDPLLV